MTHLCAVFCRLLRVSTEHYVFSFNFPELPSEFRRRLMQRDLQQPKLFSVHSTMERKLYSGLFEIPEERLHLRLWSIGVPKVREGGPILKGRYVSAIGGNGRDYGTLIAAARLVPEIPFALVVRPGNLAGMEIPENVKVLVNAPFEDAMNILQYSSFTVLPLAGSRVPAGHVTLVCAMHLGKTSIATDSEGVHDYVLPGENGLLCRPFSPESLAEAIQELWSDPKEVERLSRNNLRFGAENCSEEKMRSDLRRILATWKIPVDASR